MGLVKVPHNYTCHFELTDSVRTIKHTLLGKCQEKALPKFSRTTATPVSFYRPDCWTLMKEHMRRMETVEMRFVRAVGGYGMAGRKRN